MRKIVLILALFSIVTITFGQKIAVLDFKAGVGIRQNDVDGLSSTFVTYFNPRGYQLVERSQIIKVINEQGFQKSTLTEDQMVRIGRIMNLTKIVIGDVNIVGGSPNLDVRVIDMQNGDITGRDGATFSWSNYRATMQQLAQRVANQIGIVYGGGQSNNSQPSGKSPSGKVEIILGYLYVYPEDLGSFNGEPTSVIKAVNNQKLNSYGDWRLPTDEELSLMATAKDKLGMGSTSGYMSKENRNSTNKIVRLVRTTENYTITFNPNGGSGYMSPQTFEEGGQLRLAANKFTRSNYSFSHWNLEIDGYVTEYVDEEFIDNLTSDITLYAQWTPTYTVTFYPNGGSGNMSPQTFENGVKQRLNFNMFSKNGNRFKSWNTIYDGTGIEYTDGYEITSITQDLVLYAQWEDITRGTLNSHDWVDLGLPSGTKWATCNVGASTPTAYGNYYAWGETTTKATYNGMAYTYSANPTTLPSNRDAATVNWGSGWRMPTKEEFEELKNNCTVTWTTQNGVNGCLFTGPNGNSIFLPAAGYRNYSGLVNAGSYGEYWSSSLYPGDQSLARFLYLGSDGYDMGDSNHGYGLSVRPVCVQSKK